MDWLGYFLKRFFHLLYHQMAFLYNPVAWLVSLGRWRAWVFEAIPFLDKQPILELGFGPGHLQQQLVNRGCAVFGLDESQYMCQISTRQLRKSLAPGYKFALSRGIAQNIPFAEQSFGTIVATFPSEYIFQDATINECWRVLAPGGKLVVLAGVNIGGQSVAEKILRVLFQVTYQSIDRHILKDSISVRYGKQGFKVDFHRVAHGNDQLWFLLAQKS
ncbi:MAG: class I SAM-dependent methyltransferase [Chloroflexota bacterium]|jgi:ubiquinone/menaquinone biosynthesis C-methylase UbiE